MRAQAVAESAGQEHQQLRRPEDAYPKGLPAGSVIALAEKLRVGNGALSRTLHIPQRTLTRRMSEGSRLTPVESDRTVRMVRLFAHAIEMIGDPAVRI